MRLDFLRPLYEGPGDYASLYLGASATGAELRFVPDGEQPPRSGVGALLRYPVPQA